MKTLALFALATLAGTLALAAQTTNDYAQLKADGEKSFAEDSFARAHEAYQKARNLDLSPADLRWVEFRLADTLWRSQAATQTSDTTQLDNARQQLEVLVRDITRVEDHDRVWVEVQESLGDYYWTRRNSMNFGQAWNYYQQALDWWAGTADVELARQRYLRIVWVCARPPQIAIRNYNYGNYGNQLPLDVLENALKIAQSETDKAHAHYLIALTMRNQGGDFEHQVRVPEEFEAAIKPGKSTEWYDDALFNYGQWMMGQGRAIPLKEGGWRQEPDYPKALELFRRLVREFERGETRYWDQAQSLIRNITDPVVSVSLANVFLPDSEIQYSLNWRNVKRVELTVYAVDLTKDVQLSGQEERRNNWLETIDLAGREKIKTWNFDTGDEGDYKPGYKTLRYDGKLSPGAYVLEARGEGKSARDLLLVTDASIVLKTSGSQGLVYMCNALDGSPIPEANLHLWERWYEDNRWNARDAMKKTGADGIAVFELAHPANNEQIFVAGLSTNRQAFSLGNSYWYGNNNRDNWRIYATTDRPAYRPNESVEWKFTARTYNGSVYATPSGQVVEYEIHDPRNAKVKSDKVTLNTFGSSWGSLELTDTMPLGEYRVVFFDSAHVKQIGTAVLFRLEEYKLPEFKVTVQMPEENGHKKTYRVGDKVEVNIQSDYYFGGPVANASVEVVVYQNPFYHFWPQPREFPWFYQDMDSSNPFGRYYGGQGPIIKRETLKSDAAGKASLTFETPRDSGQDFEYRIEARVTDASRREILGNGTARVTRQRYYVYPRAEHNLYRPQDKVTIEFKAMDANDQPVQTEGTVKVTRDYWYEIWLDPSGREVKGDELKRLQTSGRIFPPAPPSTNGPGWVLKFRGYEHDQILTRTVKTDTNGAAELDFTPEREGYYRVAWTSEDKGGSNSLPSPQITAETTVWVASTATTELGYRHGGLEIIVDKDTFQSGQKAPVMLVVPTNDRYVLFTVEGQELYNYQLVHVTGTVKLIELPIEEKHVPNIFLSAAMVSDRQFFMDTKQVIVPPVKNFITVDVKPDRGQFQPQEEGTFTITTLNDKKEPVAAEVSFGLVDESVYYIQTDYAGDPRQFYFGTKRSHQVQTQSTFNQKSYAKLVVGDKDELIDERDREERRRQALYGGRDYSGLASYDKDAEVMMELESKNSPARLPQQQAGFAGGAGRGGRGGGGGAIGGAVNRFALADSPAPMSASAASGLALDTMAKEKSALGLPPGAGEEPTVQVRNDFRSTIVWKPDLMTGADGKATVKVKYPDSLTTWKATARAVTAINQFGIASTNTQTKQPLIVRLQAPRFFLVGDDVVISAVVNNNTDSELNVSTKLEAEGIPLRINGDSGTLKVAANSEARMDWPVHISQAGKLKLKVTGRGGKYSDALEKPYTVYEHGIEKFVSRSGKVRGDDITIKLDLPKERKPGSTALSVQLTPSMAVTMLDALPYLIDYPYGCTEQTMSRFLPATITAKTLKDLGLTPEDVMGRAFGGIEATNAAATHTKGAEDLKKLDEMTKASLERLYDFQHGDGGWGWWKEGNSDNFMTAYVVWGMTLARDAGINIKSDALDRAVSYLDNTIVQEEVNYDMQAWMLHALATYHSSAKRTSVGQYQNTAFTNLWTNREKLNAYTRALLALSAHSYGKTNEAKTLIENLENGVKIDNSPDTSVVMQGSQASGQGVIGTAHWGEDGIYWRWSEGGVEATAFALRALMTIDPTNQLVEPVCNWLVKNRRGAQWSNTRDTAIVVLTMNDYLRKSGELSPDLDYELFVNGRSIARKKLTGAEVFNAPSKFVIETNLIKDGENLVRIVRRSGKGPIYFAANATFFSLEEPITPAGNEIFVRRQYYKLAGRPTLLKGYVYDREPLNDGDTIKSGERVETVITIEAKNNYEYLLFEDLKPAGLEAVAVRSGESLFAYEMKSGAVDRKFGTDPGNSPAPTTIEAAPPTQTPAPRRGVARGGGGGGGAQTTPSAGRRGSGPTTRGPTGVRGPVRTIAPRPIPAPPQDSDHTGRSRWVYQELRDRKVALFVDKLPQGVWEVKYDQRAEVPGTFHALPVVGHAMYVPEIRCNGLEIKINVQDPQMQMTAR